MVRLLQSPTLIAVWQRVSFNPTMVRLLPFNFDFEDGRDSSFQSHNGAIAAC